MYIFDTLSGKRKELSSRGKRINMFVCGPTVYDYAHLGHARTYVFFDAAVKYLRSRGADIFYLQNITDIDDKIIKRAKEAEVDPKALAEKFTKAYLSDMRALGVDSVDKYASATKFIPAVVRQIKTLIKKGYAYKTSDGYYFDINKFKGYGKLSGRTAAAAEDSVSRIDEGTEKKNKGDFALWKFHRSGEPFWETSLGAGRPGWHIEDTAISEKFFGPQYDLHGGGVDLKFPHHEAEISQQEAASGLEPFVKTWMHTGLLLVDGVKMSKSLGNYVTIKDFLEKHGPDVFRLMVLMHHYRSNVNYTAEFAASALASLDSVKETVDKLLFVSDKSSERVGGGKINGLIKFASDKFDKLMSDDFNTAGAVASVFEFISALNPLIWSLGTQEAEDSAEFIINSLKSLGLYVKSKPAPLKIKAMLAKRDKLRGNKQFIPSDALRNKIESLGYKVEDTPLGSFARKKQ